MEKIYIAKLGKTVGLDGYLKLHIESDFPEQFKKNAKFLLNSKTTITIEKYNKDRGIVKFVGYDNIDDAKKLINQQLYTTLEDTQNNCKLEDNQYFWFDIIGCKIVEEDNILGTVKDVQRYPLNDYLEITTDKVLVEKGLPKVYLIPYLDLYIKSVDLEYKNIYTSNTYEILENS